MKTFLRVTAVDFLLEAFRLLRSATSETGILLIGWLVLVLSIPIGVGLDPEQCLNMLSNILMITLALVAARVLLRVAGSLIRRIPINRRSWR